jgi:hypothetical protein
VNGSMIFIVTQMMKKETEMQKGLAEFVEVLVIVLKSIMRP